MMSPSGDRRVVSGESASAAATHHSPLATHYSPIRYKAVTLLLTCIAWGCASAQDIHFSQFFNAPYAASPANIGLFEGQYRVGGVFRQQWRSVTVPYRTFGLGGDMTNVGGVEGLGAGLWLYNDRAGDSRLNTLHLSLGGSWTEKLGPLKDQSITGGLQIGFTSLSIDYSQLEEQTVRFLADRTRNRYNAENRSLEVSKIFDSSPWYAGDFRRGWKGYHSLESFFAKYASLLADKPEDQKVLRDQQARIRHIDYDWGLNDAKR